MRVIGPGGRTYLILVSGHVGKKEIICKKSTKKQKKTLKNT